MSGKSESKPRQINNGMKVNKKSGTSFTSFEKFHTHTRQCRAIFLNGKLTKKPRSCDSIFHESEIHVNVEQEVYDHFCRGQYEEKVE